MDQDSSYTVLEAPAVPDKTAPRRRRRPRDEDERPVKRRTKSGCLTCRKRRIKCDEGRPVCRNCHKSRRDCEYASGMQGLGQRILPLESYVNDQPVLGECYDSRNQSDRSRRSSSNHVALSDTQRPASIYTASTPLLGTRMSDTWPFDQVTNNDISASSPLHDAEARNRSAQPSLTNINGYSEHATLNRYNNHGSFSHSSNHSLYSPLPDVPIYNHGDSSFSRASTSNDTGSHRRDSLYPRHIAQYEEPSAQIVADHNQDRLVDWPGMSSGVWNKTGDSHSFSEGSLSEAPHQLWPAFSHNGNITQYLDAAAVAEQDDDYWDLDSDDQEYDNQRRLMLSNGRVEQDLHEILQMTVQSMSLAVAAVRDPYSYTYPGFSMSQYVPEEAANPLRNIYTQRVFAHFVFSTAPMLSFASQRNRPTLPGEAVQTGAAFSCQGLYTYVLAMMALRDSGLLQSVLAMSSYHIARLQGASTGPAFKHYTYAIKKIHRRVGTGKSRHDISTLAATLLLAFYEVMTADHRAWNTHLSGAMQLIREIDFTGMSAHIRYCKYQSSVRRRSGVANAKDQLIDSVFPDIDSRLVNQIMGRPTMLDAYGRLIETWPETYRQTELTDYDIRNYSIMQDLFHYACRHDMIHGLVSGNPLHLDYGQWTDCLPRGPVGLETAPYATFDFVVLLLGRLVKFMSKDRPRKIAVVKQKSNAYPTPPAEQNPSTPQSRPVPGPAFYGMAPTHGMPSMPRVFRPEEPYLPCKPSTPLDEDLDFATQSALNEWQDIHTAFQALGAAMGPAYEPLPPDDLLRPSVTTPFGPSLNYRSQSIAAVIAWYHAAYIILQRAHPSMPPATFQAVGASAHLTAPYAMRIGAVLWGLNSNFLQRPLDPNSAGAFTESCMPLFFAGVQFMDEKQRHWTVDRLTEIESVAGWATVALIANGCESAWVVSDTKAGLQPWTKRFGVEDINEEDERPVEDVTLASESATNGRSRCTQVDAGMHEAQLHHEQRKRGFASFKKYGGDQMWAYKMYTHEDPISLTNGH